MKLMHKYFSSAAFLILCTICFIQTGQAADKIKIGVSTPLTGNASTYGIDIKNVLLFANQKLTNNKYEFVFEDDKCAGKDAVNVAQRFINILQLKYVTGFGCSGALLSAANLFEKSKVLVMNIGASNPALTYAGDYIFRTYPSDTAAGHVLFSHMVKRYKKIGVISEQTDYAQGVYKAFAELNTDNKLKILNEDFLTDSVDFRSLLLKYKAEKIDALFINPQTELTFLAVLKQVRELGLQMPIYSFLWPGSPAVLDKAKDLAEGVIYADLPTPEDAMNKDSYPVYEEFVKQYGPLNSIGIIFLSTFEGFRALDLAISSGKDEREYLYKTPFHGIFGDWHFDENGDIQGLVPVMKIIKSGHPTLFAE